MALRFSLGLFALLGTGCTPAAAGQARRGAGDGLKHETTTADVLIIGGGAAGTYAAVSLLDRGVNAVVVEKQVDLGGHADTYTDPTTGQFTNAGVQLLHSSAIARDFAARLGIQLQPPSFDRSARSLSLDFRTGRPMTFPAAGPNVTAALQRYAQIVESTYPYLAEGFYLPSPVPEDLALPFGEFARKHGIEDAVYLFNLYTQGWDIAKVPTAQAIVINSLELTRDVLGNSFTTIPDFNDLYRNASALLGDRVLYSSSIQSLQRTADGVTAQVRTKCGSVKTVRARKLLMTGPPVLDNLAGWDVTPEETDLFRRFHTYGYYAGAVSNADFPVNTSFTNVAESEADFHIPQLPTIFSIGNTAMPNKTRLVYYATQPDEEAGKAAEMCLRDIDNLVVQQGFGQAKTKLLAWYPHGPFNLGVSSEEVRDGFYERLYGLQGKTSTWWSGATFSAHDSTQVWYHTRSLLDQLSS